MNDDFLDQAERQAQKEAARLADASDLRSGEVSHAELGRRNGFFAALDMKGTRIVAIGKREVSAVLGRDIHQSH